MKILDIKKICLYRGTFCDNCNNFVMVRGYWFYPPEQEDWEVGLGDGVQPFFAQVEAALSWCGYCDLRDNSAEEIVAACDAYYGSASPLVVGFVRAKKPVMIADYRV